MRGWHILLHDIGHHPLLRFLWSIMLTKSIGSQLLIGQCPGSIPNSGSWIALVGNAVAFYLLGIGYCFMPLPQCPNRFWVQLPLTCCMSLPVICLLFSVDLWLLAWSCIIKQTHHHQHAYADKLTFFLSIRCFHQLKLSNKLNCRF